MSWIFADRVGCWWFCASFGIASRCVVQCIEPTQLLASTAIGLPRLTPLHLTVLRPVAGLMRGGACYLPPPFGWSPVLPRPACNCSSFPVAIQPLRAVLVFVQAIAHLSEDHREAVRAFIEKRPKFRE
jgi:hypothetical protein